MKRLLTFTAMLVTVLCLASCAVTGGKTGSRKNGLGSRFQATVSVTLDRLEAEGTVKRFGDGMWEIEFSEPNTLSGVKLKFAEGNVDASYKGLSFSVPQSALPMKAMMLNLIEAVDKNAKLTELKGEEKDDMLAVSGKLDSGDYVLTVDKEGKLCGFSMENHKLEMKFTELSGITDPEDASEAETTEETTAAETSGT